MQTTEFHRGRVDRPYPARGWRHDASRRFYEAILHALDIQLGGVVDDYFWAH
jgi:hypothetical protein